MTTTRKRKLKVYGGNLDGRHRVIMACHSFKEFSAITRVGRDFGCETGNPEEVTQAMSEPGTSFKRSMAIYPQPPWEVHRKRTETEP